MPTSHGMERRFSLNRVPLVLGNRARATTLLCDLTLVHCKKTRVCEVTPKTEKWTITRSSRARFCCQPPRKTASLERTTFSSFVPLDAKLQQALSRANALHEHAFRRRRLFVASPVRSRTTHSFFQSCGKREQNQKQKSKGQTRNLFTSTASDRCSTSHTKQRSSRG